MPYNKSNLDGAVLYRYNQKIQCIKNVDPFDLTIDSNFNIKIFHDIPRIELTDIMCYFVCTNSFYTGQAFKALKSLEAVKYVDAGYVSVTGFKINEHFVLLEKVRILKFILIFFVHNTFKELVILILFNCR